MKISIMEIGLCLAGQLSNLTKSKKKNYCGNFMIDVVIEVILKQFLVDIRFIIADPPDMQTHTDSI